MKHLTVSIFLSAVSCSPLVTLAACAEEPPAKVAPTTDKRQEPLDVIEKQGALALVQGDSYYVFEKNGIFRSGPIGMSGRTFFGYWKSNASSQPILEVVAHRSWINGLSADNVYNRISFYIGSGTVKDGQPGIWSGGKKPIFDGYWFIDALEKIEKPANFDEQMSKIKNEERPAVPIK